MGQSAAVYAILTASGRRRLVRRLGVLGILGGCTCDSNRHAGSLSIICSHRSEWAARSVSASTLTTANVVGLGRVRVMLDVCSSRHFSSISWSSSTYETE